MKDIPLFDSSGEPVAKTVYLKDVEKLASELLPEAIYPHGTIHDV